MLIVDVGLGVGGRPLQVTDRSDFVFYADRIIRLLVEEGNEREIAWENSNANTLIRPELPAV